KGLKNAQLTVSIPKDGTYTIAATRSQEAQGTTTGDYILKVEAKQEGPEILPIRYGGTVTGSIDSQRFLYYYSFRGNANDVVTIHMSHIPGHSLDPALYLYDYTTGQAQLIASNNDEAPGDKDSAIVKFTLPHTGAYLIVATRLGAAQGQTEGSFIVTLTKGSSVYILMGMFQVTQHHSANAGRLNFAEILAIVLTLVIAQPVRTAEQSNNETT